METFRRPDRVADFADSFHSRGQALDLPPKALMAHAIAQTPAWFEAMLRLRDRIGRLFGLKTATDIHEQADASFLMHLPVLRDDESVYSSGAADKHLDFAITVEKHEDATVSFTTEVWFNGASGRVYLALILPFHRAILRHWVSVVSTNTEAEA
ncbi:MAG: DUF2867 domain-containing protein [Pikeienuella sp.]